MKASTREANAAGGGGPKRQDSQPTDIASALRASAWRKEVSLENPSRSRSSTAPDAPGPAGRQWPPGTAEDGQDTNLPFFVWLSGEKESR